MVQLVQSTSLYIQLGHVPFYSRVLEVRSGYIECLPLLFLGFLLATGHVQLAPRYLLARLVKELMDPKTTTPIIVVSK